MTEVTREEFQRLLIMVESNCNDIRDVKKAVIGNGNYDESLIARIQHLEYRIGNTPTWQWLLERTALPVIMVLIGLLLGYYLGP